MSNGYKTKAQHKKVAKCLKEGLTLKESLINAGYSEKQAAKGWGKVSRGIVQAIMDEGLELATLGKQLTPEVQANLVRGRLARNVITGTDVGAQSAKLLGSEKSVNLFVPDSTVGIICVVAPEQHEVLPIVEDYQLPESGE